MNIADFISQYGYLAIMIGAPIEGDLVLILAGLAVHLGYLDSMGLVISFALVGVFASDILFFSLGKWKGTELMVRFPRLKKWTKVPTGLIHRNPALVAFTLRFFYGLRTVVPFTLGFSSMSFRRFIPFNVIGALLWTTLLAWLGFFFGAGINSYFHKIKQYEFSIILYVAIAFVAGHLINELIRWSTIRLSDEE